MTILVMVIIPWMFLLMTKLSSMDLSQWARQASIDRYCYVDLKHQRWFLRCCKRWRNVEIPRSSFKMRRLRCSWVPQSLNYKEVLHSSFRRDAWWFWRLWASGLGSKHLSCKVLFNARLKMITKWSLQLVLWPILCQGLPSCWGVSLNHETELNRRPLSNTLVPMSNGLWSSNYDHNRVIGSDRLVFCVLVP